MEKHRTILRQISNGEFPDRVFDRDYADIQVVLELFEAHLITGANFSDENETGFGNLSLTMEGRAMLDSLDQEAVPKKWYQQFSNRIAVLSVLVAILSIVATFWL